MMNNYTPTEYYSLTVYFPEWTIRGWQVLEGTCLGMGMDSGKYLVTLGYNSTVIRYVDNIFTTRKAAWASIADIESSEF